LWTELEGQISLEDYLSRGAFPRSLLSASVRQSFTWRESFISTFIERDLAQWAGFAPNTMLRLWQMLAHVNGQTVDYTRLSSSLGVSSPSVKRYIELLASTYMLEIVRPFVANAGKRLVKAPKVYIADSGISAALLGLASFEDILGHPGFGSLWEQVVLATIVGNAPDARISHYRSAKGAEIDFVLERGQQRWAVECKASSAPKLSRGNHNALADINPQQTFVVTPAEESWPLSKGIEVVSLKDFSQALRAEMQLQ
jgi:predicted AAA+ superfamily ATPase